MKTFIKRLLVFFIPLLLLGAITIGSFYLYDPFKILKEYSVFENSIVAYNEDFVATERFVKNKNVYNSYILGSSRAGCGFKITDWEKKLDQTAKAFSFTASNESIFGIVGKLRLIDKLNSRLDNVIVVIDLDRTMKKTVNSTGHLYIKHPLVSDESQKAFTYEYLKDYIFTGFFFAYLDYRFFNTERDYLKKFLTLKNKEKNGEYVAFDLEAWEDQIQANPIEYYNKRKEIFYQRSDAEQSYSPLIGLKSKQYLSEIKALFKKHNTNYRIVISPLYNQKKINDIDLNILKSIFGKSKVFNFSGKNSITENVQNYYETSHYRIHIGNQIFSEIYSQ